MTATRAKAKSKIIEPTFSVGQFCDHFRPLLREHWPEAEIDYSWSRGEVQIHDMRRPGSIRIAKLYHHSDIVGKPRRMFPDHEFIAKVQNFMDGA